MRGQHYYHTFSADAPDLNLRNQAVLQRLDVIMLQLSPLSINAIRLKVIERLTVFFCLACWLSPLFRGVHFYASVNVVAVGIMFSEFACVRASPTNIVSKISWAFVDGI